MASIAEALELVQQVRENLSYNASRLAEAVKQIQTIDRQRALDAIETPQFFVTYNWLKDVKRVCEQELEAFRETFGNWAVVSEGNLARVIARSTPSEWLMEILPGEARDEFYEKYRKEISAQRAANPSNNFPKRAARAVLAGELMTLLKRHGREIGFPTKPE